MQKLLESYLTNLFYFYEENVNQDSYMYDKLHKEFVNKIAAAFNIDLNNRKEVDKLECLLNEFASSVEEIYFKNLIREFFSLVNNKLND